MDTPAIIVPEGQDSWTPEGYQVGVDDPGPVETECTTEEGLA